MRESYKRWLEEGCPKVFCGCSKREEIVITKQHKYDGIPKYIRGHGKGRLGTSCSEKTKQKLREKNLGKKKSKESKIKLSNSAKINPNYGMKNKKHSEESKQKNRKSHLIKPIPKNTGIGKGCYYNSPLQGKIWLRSSYELSYTKYLDSKNILWYYEIETFDLGYTIYTPDFFLVDDNKFIEIKGYMTNEAQEKINKFKEQYSYNLEILYGKDLIKLGCKL